MKKFFVSSFLLSLSMLFAQPLTAQIKVLPNGDVKMGNLSSSTSTTYNLEIGYPKIRISPTASRFAAGKTSDIYITEECSSGGIITTSSSVNASAIRDCKAVISGNIQLGTAKAPAKVLGSLTSPTSSGVSVISDRRCKDNIRNMEGGLAEILRLIPIRFDYKQFNEDESPWDSLARLNKVGFIAQDVETVIPEAVNYDYTEDLYSLNQTDFIPYMVAGIQELHAVIQELTDRIAVLEAENAALSTPTFNSVSPKGEPAETVTAETNRLWSNVPNPFKQETRIRYALTEDVREAQLCIYDLSGKQLACHRLMDRGESEFTLRAASLMPGIYLYSLIADGNVIDTHRMVVTE